MEEWKVLFIGGGGKVSTTSEVLSNLPAPPPSPKGKEAFLAAMPGRSKK